MCHDILAEKSFAPTFLWPDVCFFTLHVSVQHESVDSVPLTEPVERIVALEQVCFCSPRMGTTFTKLTIAWFVPIHTFCLCLQALVFCYNPFQFYFQRVQAHVLVSIALEATLPRACRWSLRIFVSSSLAFFFSADDPFFSVFLSWQKISWKLPCLYRCTALLRRLWPPASSRQKKKWGHLSNPFWAGPPGY